MGIVKLKDNTMKKYKFNPRASSFHVNLHKKTLEASINYDKKRGNDTSNNEDELRQLKEFYKI